MSIGCGTTPGLPGSANSQRLPGRRRSDQQPSRAQHRQRVVQRRPKIGHVVQRVHEVHEIGGYRGLVVGERTATAVTVRESAGSAASRTTNPAADNACGSIPV